MHSWNETYLGDMVCSLYKSQSPSESQPQLIYSTTIKGNIDPVTGTKLAEHTVPKQTILSKDLKKTGNESYTMSCRKNDNRFSCIDGISIAEYVLL